MRRSKGVWLLLLVILSTTACQRGEDDTWPRIQESGVLRVGLDPTYPPFENADDRPLEGLDVDLARTLADALALTPQFVHFGYDGLYDALGTHQVDVLISALIVQPEKTREFAYSTPYFDAGQHLFVPAGSTTISEMRDLDGGSVAVELGAEGQVAAVEWTRRLADLTVIPYATAAEALAAASRGDASAALVDHVSGRLAVADHGTLERIPTPVTSVPYVLVVRSGDRQLLNHLNDALGEMRESGRLDAIIAAWLD